MQMSIYFLKDKLLQNNQREKLNPLMLFYTAVPSIKIGSGKYFQR